ncbi:MAG: hypothetical protein JF588_03275 [Caulobacterales bacterium]|nr:hypothetical protein [Caulobacterales bacterium]
MRPLHAFRKTLAILGVALAVAVGLSLLPENPYQRWKLLAGTIHARSQWIYERSHFDPQPVDVVFLGPSRIGAGVDAPRLGAALAARGLPSNVVNFSLPEAGRNINWIIFRELMQTKRPKLVVIGVMEKPSRFGHSTYKFLAPRADIVNPGYPTDFNYLSDLVYLPYRQAELFVADLAPGVLGPTKTFDPAHYRGHTVNTTGDVVLPGGGIKHASYPATMSELMRGVNKWNAGIVPPILPRKYADYEFGDERYYIRKIVTLAHARGAQVTFLFLPYYTGATELQEQDFYDQFGPTWNAGFVADHSEMFADYGHLTSPAADDLTDWLVAPVAEALQGKAQPR